MDGRGLSSRQRLHCRLYRIGILVGTRPRSYTKNAEFEEVESEPVYTYNNNLYNIVEY